MIPSPETRAVLVSLCLSLALCPDTAHAQAPPSEEATLPMVCRLDYARWLQGHGEDYRAVGELIRCRYLAADDKTRAGLDLHMAEIYLSARQYDRALRAFERAEGLLPDPRPRDQLHKAAAHYHLRQLPQALTLLQAKAFESPRLEASRLAYLGLIAIEARQWDAARASFEQSARACGEQTWTSCTLAKRNLVWMGEGPPDEIYPWLAGTLSAVLPGSGQIYGRSGVDAVYYGGLMGLTGFLAFDTYKGDAGLADQSAGFYTLVGVGAFIYAANIIGAYNNAHRYNALQRQKYLDKLLAEPHPRPGDPGDPIAP